MNYYWKTTGTGAYDDPSNWALFSPTGPTASAPPTADDDVFVSGGSDASDAVTLTISDPRAPGLAATLSLSGFVVVAGPLFPTDAVLGAGTVTLTAGGELLASSTLAIGGAGIATAVVLQGGVVGGSAATNTSVTELAVGSSITGHGQIQGVVHDAGVIDAENGLLVITDTVDGAGIIRIGSGASLDLFRNCTVSAIDLVGTGHTIQLSETGLASPIRGLSAGDRILLASTDDTLTSTANPDGSVSVVLSGGGTAQDSLVLGDGGNGVVLALEHTAAGPYALIAVPAMPANAPPVAAGADGDTFYWTGGADGAWNASGNWYDVSTSAAATVAPGAADHVLITGGTGTPDIITGTGAAADVSTRGDLLLDGTFRFGALDDTAATTAILGIAPGAVVTVEGDMRSSSGVQLTGAGATLAVGDTLSVDTGTIRVDGGATLRSETLVLGAGTEVDVAPTGLVQLGAALLSGDGRGGIAIGDGGRLVIDDPAVALDGFNTPDVPSLPPVISNQGTVELRAGVLGSGTEIEGGLLQIDAGDGFTFNNFYSFPTGPAVTADTTIRFAGANAGLYLAPLETSAAAPLHVDGFADSDDLIVAGTVTAMATDVSAERTIITLDTVATSGTTASVVFEFDGDYRSDTFTLQPLQDRFRQSYTGLDLDNSVPCFCPGTLIATPTGERPVEALRIGDPVRTAAGATRPILWIGRRTYPAHIAAGRTDLHPVLVLAGALGHGAPRRDLLLSPEHAVLVDDVLVPAALLVNGVSILREPPAGELSYLHVELEHHDLILAEGAPAESFVDDGSRALFDNAAEYAALYPDRRATPPAWCAPRIEHGDRLLAAQRRIDRLAALGGGHPAARLLGRLDDAGPGRLRGWAWCPDHPDAPVLLDLVSGDRVMGQVLADRFRADLLHAGIGDGCHGFETGLPSGAVGHLQLRRASDGARLPA